MICALAFKGSLLEPAPEMRMSVGGGLAELDGQLVNERMLKELIEERVDAWRGDGRMHGILLAEVNSNLGFLLCSQASPFGACHRGLDPQASGFRGDDENAGTQVEKSHEFRHSLFRLAADPHHLYKVSARPE